MRSTRILMTAALPLLLAVPPVDDLSTSPALGGEGSQGASRKKCTYSANDCLSSMKAHMKAVGWVGIEYQADEKTGRVVVQQVVGGSPAEKAGLQEDDVLIAMDGVAIRRDNEQALAAIRKTWRPGQSVRYTIRRACKEMQVLIVLGEWPADRLARYLNEHMLTHADEVAAAPAAPPDPPVPPK